MILPVTASAHICSQHDYDDVTCCHQQKNFHYLIKIHLLPKRALKVGGKMLSQTRED